MTINQNERSKYYYQQGQAMIKLHKIEEALINFEKAIEIDPVGVEREVAFPNSHSKPCL
ncbi:MULTISPECIES: tetratricopeptide repeat protein, partial [unclassified Limnospira]